MVAPVVAPVAVTTAIESGYGIQFINRISTIKEETTVTFAGNMSSYVGRFIGYVDNNGQEHIHIIRDAKDGTVKLGPELGENEIRWTI